MAKARAGILCLIALSWLLPAQATDEQLSELRRLDEHVQSIKQQALLLELDYNHLQNQTLYPPEQQLRVFLSMDVFDFDLRSIELSSNRLELADHLYTPREVYALRKGGVQELYVGNISPGVHTLRARIVGRFADSAPGASNNYEKTVELTFRKGEQAQWLEMRIDRSTDQQLKIRVFEQEPSQ